MRTRTLTIIGAIAVAAASCGEGNRRVDDDPASRAAGPNNTNMTETTLSPGDVTFLTTAAQAGSAEIELVRLAESTSEDKTIDDLARRLERDHQSVNDEIDALADKKNVDFPNDAYGLPGPTDAQKATKDRLAELKGVAFDRAFLDQIEQNHKDSIDLFTKAATTADPDVKAFAERTLPVLKQHLQHVQDAKKAPRAAR
jgi:putative membrane protein